MITEQRKKFLYQWLQELRSSDYTYALASQIATLTPDEYSYLWLIWRAWRIESPLLRKVTTEIKNLDLTFALMILDYPWWADKVEENVTSVVYDIIVTNNLAEEAQQQAVRDAFQRFFHRYPLSAGKEFYYLHFTCSETFASYIWESLPDEVKIDAAREFRDWVRRAICNTEKGYPPREVLIVIIKSMVPPYVLYWDRKAFFEDHNLLGSGLTDS